MKVHGELATMKYAIDRLTNEVVYVDTAKNGLKCLCFCSECEQNVLAIQGGKNDWHFRHEMDSDCRGGQESAIHKLVIQMVKENTSIELPTAKVEYIYRHSKNPLNNFFPDVIIFTNDEPVFVEVKYTHASTPEKIQFYRSGKH
jgi:hypothetical protein